MHRPPTEPFTEKLMAKLAERLKDIAPDLTVEHTHDSVTVRMPGGDNYWRFHGAFPYSWETRYVLSDFSASTTRYGHRRAVTVKVPHEERKAANIGPTMLKLAKHLAPGVGQLRAEAKRGQEKRAQWRAERLHHEAMRAALGLSEDSEVVATDAQGETTIAYASSDTVNELHLDVYANHELRFRLQYDVAFYAPKEAVVHAQRLLQRLNAAFDEGLSPGVSLVVTRR